MNNFPKKNRGGRPKKKEIDKSKHQIHFLLTQNEKDRFKGLYINFIKENNLKKNYFTKTDFIKHKIFSKDTQKTFEKKNISDIVFQINKIGNNINQVTKKINSDKSLSQNFSFELNNLNSKLNEIIKIIIKL